MTGPEPEPRAADSTRQTVALVLGIASVLLCAWGAAWVIGAAAVGLGVGYGPGRARLGVVLGAAGIVLCLLALGVRSATG